MCSPAFKSDSLSTNRLSAGRLPSMHMATRMCLCGCGMQDLKEQQSQEPALYIGVPQRHWMILLLSCKPVRPSTSASLLKGTGCLGSFWYPNHCLHLGLECVEGSRALSAGWCWWTAPLVHHMCIFILLHIYTRVYAYAYICGPYAVFRSTSHMPSI